MPIYHATITKVRRLIDARVAQDGSRWVQGDDNVWYNSEDPAINGIPFTYINMDGIPSVDFRFTGYVQ